jgi:hypothetical protein
MGGNNGDCRQLAILEAAEQRLAECKELQDVLGIRGDAETIRIYAKQRRLGLRLQNHAARIKIQAERVLGATLSAMRLRGGDRKSESRRGTLILRLRDLGISRNQSSRWQLEASVSEEEFDAFCREIEQRGEELSTGAFLRLIRATWRDGGRTARRRRPVAGQALQFREPCSGENAIAEIRAHLRTAAQMFAAIRLRLADRLEPVEARELPRYLRECLELLGDVEQQLKSMNEI